MESNPMTIEAEAAGMLTNALKLLQGAEKSRECSVAITQLETALMWLNKDRTVKGELKPTATHYQQSK